ncbi:glycosyltransferase [Synechococcus sp. Cruz-9H2]|uniref:glycosyltransferase n=1 Tax=unclassified Synechococcus TaxID=2626047 RepID=UPI0020CBBC8D|nr:MULTISPECIES: glycosyltransferase [unclassified Synechococcus]MCP9818845.1 glycosyltransferase [Synechococcus sp. Cruz-9H2]MCP9843348.1 glycosyltransferase [Synechococcus sp. Edmonson 11F2]MCP9855269.1 glycosyltransferase [Synechococcus sp. Cruz-9C9]MCP9862758.1 glycosyltransferase [Synechococcus sp. Cruz-7E5]MCP9869755.1 glycosyltransferase [Synechococcus sp. Cruz-7B9]
MELLATTDGESDSFLIVFDGDPPPPPDWLVSSKARLLATGRCSGPAVARNLAAESADGEILVFVDADVELHRDAIGRIRRHFENDSQLDAVFGSYDDSPTAPGLVSQFRNLLHHHTHSSHAGPIRSFWAGCGAMRRSRFRALGGFDSRYKRPSIEDIELGMRLAAAGGQLLLDPTILCTHHKHWSLSSVVVTDIRQRALPWSRLLRRRPNQPVGLNLTPTARLSGVLTLVLVACLITQPWLGLAGWGALACLLALLWLNRSFYRFCLRARGPGFMLGAIPLHLLYFLYSSLTYGVVAVESWVQPERAPDPAAPTP